MREREREREKRIEEGSMHLNLCKEVKEHQRRAHLDDSEVNSLIRYKAVPQGDSKGNTPYMLVGGNRRDGW